MFSNFILLFALPIVHGTVAVHAASASTFAGSTSTAIFPPPNVVVAATDSSFPDATEVGFFGPTPSMTRVVLVSVLLTKYFPRVLAGDEAEAIATAPSAAKVQNVFPLLSPDSADAKADDFDVLQHLGNLSPFNSVDSFGLPDASPQIPSGCDLTQVHLLHRHGARYPTSGEAPAAFAAKLHAAATGAGFSATGSLAFLNTWTFKLGAEILTPFGRSQV